MSDRLARSAGLIGVATLASRVLGLVRDVIQGFFFATSDAADAFSVATRIPTLLRDLFAEGAMSAAFVPTVTRYLQRGGRDAAWRLGSQVINGLLVVTGVITVAGILFAEPIARYYAAGYVDKPAKFALTVMLTRVNMPFLMLIAVAAACMGMLNALRRFFIPAISPALYNVVFIACTVALVPVFMRNGIEPTLALAVGMLLGGVAQVAAQWPLLRREGYRHHWRLNPRDSGLREVLILMGPGSLGAAAAQINLLVNMSLASHTAHAASALGYAFRLMYMPVGIFSVSVATAAIPDIARHAADSNHTSMRTTISWGLRLMLMLSVPATIGLMVLARPIVGLIYAHGSWDEESTTFVTQALICYAPGIIGYSVVKIASPAFYALQDARTPVVVSVVTILANLVLNLWLNAVMGFTGLALGTAIAANVNALLLLGLLSRRIDGVDARRVSFAFAKILAASIVMALVTHLTAGWLHAWLPGAGLVPRLVEVFGAIAAGVATLAVSAWALHIEEFRQAMGRVLGKFRSMKP